MLTSIWHLCVSILINFVENLQSFGFMIAVSSIRNCSLTAGCCVSQTCSVIVVTLIKLNVEPLSAVQCLSPCHCPSLAHMTIVSWLLRNLLFFWPMPMEEQLKVQTWKWILSRYRNQSRTYHDWLFFALRHLWGVCPFGVVYCVWLRAVPLARREYLSQLVALHYISQSS